MDGRFNNHVNDHLTLAARVWQSRHSGRSSRSDSDIDITWTGLASSFAAILSALTTPQPKIVFDLIQALLGADGNSQMLRSIKQDTELLLAGPFKEGLNALRYAEEVGPDDNRYARHLEDARRAFDRAMSLTKDPREVSLDAFYLAATYALMGELDNVERRLQDSYSHAIHALWDLIESANSLNVGQVLDEKPVLGNIMLYTSAVTYGLPLLTLLPKKLKTIWHSQNQLLAAEAFLPFVNMVADCLKRIYPTKPYKHASISISKGSSTPVELEWTLAELVPDSG